MSDETMEKIVIVPPQWKIGGVRGDEVYVGVEGHAKAYMPLHRFSDGALRQLKAIYLGKIHALVVERGKIYTDIAAVNGELDRRANENACKSSHTLPEVGVL